MLALRLYGPGDIRLEEVPIPVINDNEILLKTDAAAVCGTDVRMWQNGQKGVDAEHPLIITIPCGVGGAPGGITYGLKQIFGEHVHVFLAEPTQAPCMMIGLITGKYDQVSVQDFGLTGKTEADGLAVGRCSALVARNIHHLISGEATVTDKHLYPFMKNLWKRERIFIQGHFSGENAVHPAPTSCFSLHLRKK